MKGYRFVKDDSGDNPVPCSRRHLFDMPVTKLCADDSIIFLSEIDEPGKFVFSKFTVSGDLVYRASFRTPERVYGRGLIRLPSARSDDGFLYFDWLDLQRINHDWYIVRWLKMRMKEPVMPSSLSDLPTAH